MTDIKIGAAIAQRAAPCGSIADLSPINPDKTLPTTYYTALFLERVQQFLTIHCRIACETFPVTSSEERAKIMMGQEYYCTRQRQNDKTRRVLEKSFGSEWAERYMNTMLFDCVAS